MCLTFAFEDDPLALIQMHHRLLWFSARVELSIKIRSRMDPHVWMIYPFNKAGCVLVTHGSREDPSKTCPLFLPLCQSEIWRCHSVRLIICEHGCFAHPVQIRWLHIFRSCFFLLWHGCVWQKVCGSVRKLYWDTVLTIAHLLFEETPTNPLPTNTERKRVGVAGYVPMYIHCTSLAWSWCFTIQNIAIKGTLSQPLFWIYHYSGSTITSSSSSFFSFFHCFG